MRLAFGRRRFFRRPRHQRRRFADSDYRLASINSGLAPRRACGFAVFGFVGPARLAAWARAAAPLELRAAARETVSGAGYKVRFAIFFLLACAVGAEAAGGWLGVRIRDLSEIEMDEISVRHGIREGYGVMVVAVLDGSPAARSSLQSGDVIVGFEGRPIVDSRTFQRVVAAAPLDRELPLTVLRRDGRRQLLVRLQPMPPEIAGERVAAEFGFFMRESLAQERGGARAGSVDSQALVTDVMPGSPAERGGLTPGDVLRLINGQPPKSFRDATLILSRVPLDQPLRVVVRRGEDDQLALTLRETSRP